MDAIEQAIRNAFAKGDPADPAFREKVYRSAHAALERAIQANPNLNAEAAERRRQGVMAAIGSIEADYVAASRRAAPVAPAAPPVEAPARRSVEAPARPGTEPGSRVEPSIGLDPGFGGAGAEANAATRADTGGGDWPDLGDARGDPLPGSRGPQPGYDAPLAGAEAPSRAPAPDRPRRRLPWGSIAGLIVLAVVIVVGLWAVAELGLLELGRDGSGSQTSQSAPADNAAPRRPGEADALEDWVTVFSPDDPATVVAQGGARAEAMQDGADTVMRIASGPSGAAVSFDVGQGVLERIAGKRAVFDIVARAAEGGEAQMSVSCDFAGLGDCGRNRYSLAAERAEYLFEVDVPAGSPSGAGTISIVSDVAEGGRAADIFEIRVTTVEPAN